MKGPSESSPDRQFEVALDVCKQLLTLATAVVALTISLWKDVVGGEKVGTYGRLFIGTSWLFFLMSIVCGLWCCYAIAGSVAKPISESEEIRTIYDPNVAIPMGGQQLTFLVAIAAIVAFGIASI